MTPMTAIGGITKQMGGASTRMSKELDTRVNGKTTSNMAKELKNGRKVRSSKDNTSNRRNRDKEGTLGWTDPLTMENASGQTADDMKDGGTEANSMASVFTLTRNEAP